MFSVIRAASLITSLAGDTPFLWAGANLENDCESDRHTRSSDPLAGMTELPAAIAVRPAAERA
jgi:hypothetical protein